MAHLIAFKFVILSFLNLIYARDANLAHVNHALGVEGCEHGKGVDTGRKARVNENHVLGVNKSTRRGALGLEICEKCGCSRSSYRDLASSSDSNSPRMLNYEAFVCSECNIDLKGHLSDYDCVYGVISREKEKTEPGYDDSSYRTLFVGRSNLLTNSRISNSLLGNIFEPILEWKKTSEGSMLDNCRLFRDGDGDLARSYFNTRYIYSIKTDGNCTFSTAHFVNKYSGKVIKKNQKISINGNHTLTVFSFENVKINHKIHRSINLHQEYNFTHYKVPHIYKYSKLNKKWIPTQIQKPIVELNPNLLLDYLFLLFQVDKNSSLSAKFCDIKSVYVNLYVQCKPSLFPPEAKYTREYVEGLLDNVYEQRKGNFTSFLAGLEEKLKHTIKSLVPSALLEYESKYSSKSEQIADECLNSEHGESVMDSINSPLSTLSHSCKESLYLGEIPETMGKYGHKVQLYNYSELDSYLNPTDILEERQQDSLLETIESILDGNQTSTKTA